MNLRDQKYLSELQLKCLLKTVSSSRRILILTHGNPDPDAIASAFALKYLLTHSSHCRVRVAYPGIVGRRENRAMVHELALKMIPLADVNWRDYDTLALIDHQPRRRMYTWPEDRWPDIVIDHHPRRRFERPVTFSDVRTQFGSNSSMMTSYLHAAGLVIPRWLATSLVYGIRTDTQDFTRGRILADKSAFLFLFESVDHQRLFRISHPVVDAHNLSEYWKALHNATMWSDAVVSFIGSITVPDTTSEIADDLVVLQGIRYALVTGYFMNTLYVSLRIRNRRRDAGALIRRIVGRRGSAGGHGFMAGAQIPNIASVADAASLADSLHHSFIRLVVNDEDSVKSRPLLLESPV